MNDLFQSLDLSKIFLYIPGILIFLVGSGQVKKWMRIRRKGACTYAEIIKCEHIVRKDSKDRNIYNYYDITAEYTNEDGHKEKLLIKSPTEYAKGQQARLYKGTKNEQPFLVEEQELLFNPFELLFGGALLILLAMEQNRNDETAAMVCLTLLLVGAGISLIINYVNLKKKHLVPIKAEVTDIYERQISKESKIIKGAKFTYYPIVQFMLDNKRHVRRCFINSSSKNSFKKGNRMTLYYDEKTKTVLENHARVGVLIGGIIVLCAGLLAGASLIAVGIA